MEPIKTDIEELHNQLETIKAEFMAKIDQSAYDSESSTTSRIEAYKNWVAQLGITIKDEEKTGLFESMIKLNKKNFDRISSAIMRKDMPAYHKFHKLNGGLLGLLFQTDPAKV
jgi:hypothetical protein